MRHADGLLAASDRDCFFDALAALPNLDVMHLDGQPIVCELLSSTMSRPRHLRLSAGRGTRPHTSGAFTGIYLSEHLGESLQELYFKGSVILAENLRPAGVVFPRLRTLTVRFGYCASLANIAGAFPDLRTLKLLNVSFAANQPLAVWTPGLDCVQLEKDLRRTPAVPLACRVRRLELLTAVNQSERRQFFVTLLSSALPIVLFLTITHDDIASWLAEIARVAPGLKYLHVVSRSLNESIVVSMLPSCVVIAPLLTITMYVPDELCDGPKWGWPRRNLVRLYRVFFRRP